MNELKFIYMKINILIHIAYKESKVYMKIEVTTLPPPPSHLADFDLMKKISITITKAV